MAESEEALQLKRRARRRLIGAIALVTLAIIVLPLVLDKEPGPAGPPLDVQIPSQDSGSFTPRALPPVSVAPAAPAQDGKSEVVPPEAAVPVAGTTAPAGMPQPQAAKQPALAPAKALPAAEQQRTHAVASDEAWVISLDAFADKKNVAQLRNKLSAAGVKSYTEPVKTSKGELTRVRAGPFASKGAADKARVKLEAMGLKPGAVTSR